ADIGAFEAQTHVLDTTPPDITRTSDIVVNKALTLCESLVTFAPSVRDNCDPGPSVTCTPPSGSTFPLGATTVTCQAVDASGNTNQCSFTVTVVDQPPVANATVAPTFAPLSDAEALLFAVISANNASATVKLDASSSSDPDGDALAY